MALKDLVQVAEKEKGEPTSVYVGAKLSIEDHAELCGILGISTNTGGTAVFKLLLRDSLKQHGMEVPE